MHGNISYNIVKFHMKMTSIYILANTVDKTKEHNNSTDIMGLAINFILHSAPVEEKAKPVKETVSAIWEQEGRSLNSHHDPGPIPGPDD